MAEDILFTVKCMFHLVKLKMTMSEMVVVSYFTGDNIREGHCYHLPIFLPRVDDSEGDNVT